MAVSESGTTQSLVVEKAQIPVTKADGARSYCLSIKCDLICTQARKPDISARVQL